MPAAAAARRAPASLQCAARSARRAGAAVAVDPPAMTRAQRRALYRLGAERYRDIVLLRAAERAMPAGARAARPRRRLDARSRFRSPAATLPPSAFRPGRRSAACSRRSRRGGRTAISPPTATPPRRTQTARRQTLTVDHPSLTQRASAVNTATMAASAEGSLVSAMWPMPGTTCTGISGRSACSNGAY